MRMRPAPPHRVRHRERDQRAAVKLAVYRAGDDEERSLARLRRAGRFRLACFSPRRTLTTLLPSAYDIVLWELAPGHQPDRLGVSALAKRLPVISYSTTTGPKVVNRSRRLGFTAHLRSPLSPEDIAGQLSRVKRIDLFARIRKSQRTLRTRLGRRATLADIVNAVNPTLEPKKIAEGLLVRLAGWFPAQNWAVVTFHESGEAATLADRGVSALLESPLEHVARWIMDKGEEFAAADLSADRRIKTRGTVSMLVLPLLCRGRPIGVAVAAERGPSSGEIRWSPGLRTALRAILEPPAFALDHALRYQRAQALSVTDDLTQLHNARYLNHVLRRETKRASRSGRPLSLLFLDLDGFKAINDTHGHLSGSRALVEAADVVRASARETDVCARFGGDEFAVILPDTGGEGAYAVGERIRDRIAAHTFLAREGQAIHLTASVGVATLPDVAASADELMLAADRAMYRVKEGGKNSIAVASDEALGFEDGEKR